MKLITANKINRLWVKGIKPIKDAVEKKFELAKIINSEDTIRALTQAGYVPDALIMKQLINNLAGYSFGETADGQPGYRKPGADTVIPFRNFNVLTHGYNEKNYSTATSNEVTIIAPADRFSLIVTFSVRGTRTFNGIKITGANNVQTLLSQTAIADQKNESGYYGINHVSIYDIITTKGMEITAIASHSSVSGGMANLIQAIAI